MLFILTHEAVDEASVRASDVMLVTSWKKAKVMATSNRLPFPAQI